MIKKEEHLRMKTAFGKAFFTFLEDQQTKGLKTGAIIAGTTEVLGSVIIGVCDTKSEAREAMSAVVSVLVDMLKDYDNLKSISEEED